MTDYTELTDDEINEAVRQAVIRNSTVDFTKPQGTPKTVVSYDYCGEWALAGELLEEMGAELIHDYHEKLWFCSVERGASDWDENPRRAISECYLQWMDYEEGEG